MKSFVTCQNQATGMTAETIQIHPTLLYNNENINFFKHKDIFLHSCQKGSKSELWMYLDWRWLFPAHLKDSHEQLPL